MMVVFSRYPPGFLPHLKNMHISLIGECESKWSVCPAMDARDPDRKSTEDEGMTEELV